MIKRSNKILQAAYLGKDLKIPGHEKYFPKNELFMHKVARMITFSPLKQVTSKDVSEIVIPKAGTFISVM